MMLSEKDHLTLINLIESINPNQFKGLTTKIKYLYPNIFNQLKKKQKDLNIKTFSEVLYLEINDMDSIPCCEHLTNKCYGNLKFKSLLEGYFPYCKACSSKSEEFIIKRKETNILRYGVEYATKNKTILNKIEKTNLFKYGVKNVKQIKK